MKSFLIILFSLNLFTSGMLFGEIAKLPAVSQHFGQHRSENPETTFMEFLWLHYFDAKHANDTTHNHHSLPFHHHCGHSIAQVVATTPGDHVQNVVLPSASSDLVHTAADFYYSHFLPVGFKGSVFQPPKA